MTTHTARSTASLIRPLGAIGLGFLVAMTPVAAAAQAEGREISSDGIDRIGLANVLPMLTQQVAAASCALTSDINIRDSRDILRRSAAQFEATVFALQEGNPDLNIIGPEQRASIANDIDVIRREWAPVHNAIASILADGHDTASARVIDDHNLALLEQTSVLVSDFTGNYSDPFVLTQLDAIMFRITIRQRVLIQQMAKDACEIWTSYHVPEAKDELTQSMAKFESSLNALRYGMPEVGIPEAPTAEMRDDLDDLINRWNIIKVNLTALANGEQVSEEAKSEIFNDLNTEMTNVDRLMVHYREYSKRNH